MIYQYIILCELICQIGTFVDCQWENNHSKRVILSLVRYRGWKRNLLTTNIDAILSIDIWLEFEVSLKITPLWLLPSTSSILQLFIAQSIIVKFLCFILYYLIATIIYQRKKAIQKLWIFNIDNWDLKSLAFLNLSYDYYKALKEMSLLPDQVQVELYLITYFRYLEFMHSPGWTIVFLSCLWVTSPFVSMLLW